MKKTPRPDRAAVAKSLRELEKLFGKKPPDKKQSAQRELGAESESHTTAKSTGDDSTSIGKKFNHADFLTACAGDVAVLHLALVNITSGHALTAPAVLHMAGRGIALAYIAAGGAL